MSAFIFLFYVLCSSVYGGVGPVQSSRPNVLLIVSDDLRPSIGCYGDHIAITPNIDQMCHASLRFNKAYVQQAFCAPSRSSFLTSRRPDSTHVYDLHTYWRTAGGNFTTLPQHFKQNGYETISVGKIFHPGIASGKSDDYPYSWSQKPFKAPTQKYANSKVCVGDDDELHYDLLCPVDVDSQPGKTLPDIEITGYAIESLANISRKRDAGIQQKPFFLAVGFHKPHVPFKYPREFNKLYPVEKMGLAKDPNLPPNMPPVAWAPYMKERSREDMQAQNISFPFGPIPVEFQKRLRQGYYAATTYMDSLLGQLLTALDEFHFSENTIILFVGDHGWSLGEHQDWAKYSNYDVTTRVPFILHIPNVTNAVHNNENKFQLINPLNNDHLSVCHRSNHPGFVSDYLVELVDIFPTLTDLCGLPKPETCPVSGFSSFCTEGSSLVPLVEESTNYSSKIGRDAGRKHGAGMIRKWKSAVFSQFPRPSYWPQANSDKPSLSEIKIMGYTMRNETYSFTQWVSFNTSAFQPIWSEVWDEELYLLLSDPYEDMNCAYEKKHESILIGLRELLQLGWRNALPVLT